MFNETSDFVNLFEPARRSPVAQYVAGSSAPISFSSTSPGRHLQSASCAIRLTPSILL